MENSRKVRGGPVGCFVGESIDGDVWDVWWGSPLTGMFGMVGGGIIDGDVWDVSLASPLTGMFGMFGGGVH